MSENAGDGPNEEPAHTGETTVCKLGGSVVTVKDEPESVDQSTLAATAAALAAVDGDLVVVHGGGSFGHHHAAEHGVTATDGTRDATAVRTIHGAMVALNEAVVDALQDQGVPAVPVQPLSIAARNRRGELSMPTAAIEGLLTEGFVPVVHGDVIAHGGEGTTVLSGDELVVRLATAVDADRVGVCSSAPGVLDETGVVVDRIEAYDEVADALGASEATDVTGGMAGKVAALLELDAPSSVFGPADLPAFVAGEQPGTTIDGR